VATSRIVSDLRMALGPDRVALDLDDGVFPRDAVYAAAFAFIDRCYVHLEHPSEGRTGILLRPKATDAPAPFDAESVAAELKNELLGQAWRQRLVEQGRELTAAITAGAFGGADETLAAGAEGGDAPFDDPLGIALQWEQQKAPGSADPQTPGEGEQST
jgi:His-Xaa-Ser system protein HxsD